MHRFQSTSTIYRVRFAALFLWLRSILIPVVVISLIYGLIKEEPGHHELVYLAIGLAGLTVVVSIIQWVLASKTRCPLCMTPVLANKACSKHRNAKKLFGSYRLRVATSVLLKGSFHCPYCHEPSVLKVRERRGEFRMEARTR